MSRTTSYCVYIDKTNNVGGVDGKTISEDAFPIWG